MKTIEVKGELRDNLGKKGTKAIRKTGQVPGVIYGGSEIVHFSFDEKEFRHVLFTPEVFFVQINVGGKQYKTIIKDMQFHPVSDGLVHVDFKQVFEDKKVEIGLPIEITGSSEGIRSGGKLKIRRRKLKVKGLPKDMPEKLVVDITPLNINDSLYVRDLSYNNLELIDPQGAHVVTITSSRAAAKAAEAEKK